MNSGPLSELAFSAATGMMGAPMSGAGEAPEPALDVSTGPCAGEHLELGLGGAYLLSPGSMHFIEAKTVTPPWLPDLGRAGWVMPAFLLSVRCPE